MSVSKLLPLGGANDFNVAVTDTHTSVTFTKEYSPGAYTITSTGADTTFDIYAYNANGALAGYTNTPALTTTIGFNKLVIIGHTAGILLSFTYKTTYTTTSDNDEVTAGPFITSASTASLHSINNSTTITGGNFASDITATFTGTGYTATSAKSVTRNSATSVVVVRPDSLPVSGSPYTLKLSNPGVTDPIGSNSHITTITAGSIPTWTTPSGSIGTFSRNSAFSTTVVAADPDGGTISYSVTTGALPAGLTLASSTGVISGTPTDSAPSTFSITATDQGGNPLARSFTLLNAGPVWVTSTIDPVDSNTAKSLQLSATDDQAGAVVYSITAGALPTGLTMTSGGLISGTVTATAFSSYTVTVAATDSNSTVASRTFSGAVGGALTLTSGSGTLNIPSGTYKVLVVAGGGGGAGAVSGDAAAGGGGGGGGLVYNAALALSGTYSYSIGNGGGGGTSNNNGGSNGGNTTFHNITANGGGGGGPQNGNAQGGGCGGGGGGNSGADSGSGSQGGNGGPGSTSGENGWSGGGGGGMAPQGGTSGPSGGQGGNGLQVNIGGTNLRYGSGAAGGKSGTAGGGGTSSGNGIQNAGGGNGGNGQNGFGGGGGGGSSNTAAQTTGGTGGSGCLIISTT
jgi:hypothetical protein